MADAHAAADAARPYSVAGEPDLQTESSVAEPRSIAETITEVAADAAALMRAELSLAGMETRGNLAAIGGAAARMAVGGVLLVLALAFLTVAGIVALAKIFGLLAALLVAAGVVALCGFALIVIGQGEIRRRHLLPVQTFARMSADLDRLQERAESIRAKSPPKAQSVDESSSNG